MRTARRTEAAERDLQDIAFHIAFTHRRALAAERIINALIAQAEKLAQLSTTTVLGTAAPEIGDGVGSRPRVAAARQPWAMRRNRFAVIGTATREMCNFKKRTRGRRRDFPRLRVGLVSSALSQACQETTS